MTPEIARIRADMAALFAEMDRAIDFCESLISENKSGSPSSANEYAAVCARQRATIYRQARLIGITPRARGQGDRHAGGSARMPDICCDPADEKGWD